MKYSIQHLKRDFPTDEACLDFLFDARHSYECSCGGEYRPLTGRKQYQCSKCRFQIAPTAGTIFHKSSTPLTLWFHALLVFAHAKSGISAKEMQRQLGVTYKTAWRMLSLIRKTLAQNKEKLKGIVEVDEAYFGGRVSAGKNNENLSRSIAAKSVLAGAVERGGNIKAKVTPNASVETLNAFMQKSINTRKTILMTDTTKRYRRITKGIERHSVNHSRKEYARGAIHINTIESFWGHIKRSVKGTHKVISKKYLQSYLDGFVWHYNRRHSDSERFSSLLGAVLLSSKG